TVKKRQENTVNKNIPTGEIEVVAETLHILNDAKNPLPLSPAENVLPNEEVRLKYRYLDLRRPEMHANIQLRHKISLAIRKELPAFRRRVWSGGALPVGGISRSRNRVEAAVPTDEL